MRGCPCIVLSKLTPYNFFLSDPTLTPNNITTAITTVEEWDQLCVVLEVPRSKRNQITRSYSTLHNKKQAVLLWWLKCAPGSSWARLAHCLCRWEESVALQQTLKYLKKPTGTGCNFSLYIINGVSLSKPTLMNQVLLPHLYDGGSYKRSNQK